MLMLPCGLSSSNSPIALIYELRNTTKDQIVFALLRELTLSFDNIPPASWYGLHSDRRKI